MIYKYLTKPHKNVLIYESINKKKGDYSVEAHQLPLDQERSRSICCHIQTKYQIPDRRVYSDIILDPSA